MITVGHATCFYVISVSSWSYNEDSPHEIGATTVTTVTPRFYTWQQYGLSKLRVTFCMFRAYRRVAGVFPGWYPGHAGGLARRATQQDHLALPRSH